MKHILSVIYPDQQRENAYCLPCTEIVLNTKVRTTRVAIGDLLSERPSVTVPTMQGPFTVRELTNAADVPCDLCKRTSDLVHPSEVEEASIRRPIAIPSTYGELKTCLTILLYSGEYKAVRMQLAGEKADDVYNAYDLLLNAKGDATKPLSPMYLSLIVHLIELLELPKAA